MFAKHGIVGGLLMLYRVYKLMLKKLLKQRYSPFRVYPGVP